MTTPELKTAAEHCVQDVRRDVNSAVKAVDGLAHSYLGVQASNRELRAKLAAAQAERDSLADSLVESGRKIDELTAALEARPPVNEYSCEALEAVVAHAKAWQEVAHARHIERDEARAEVERLKAASPDKHVVAALERELHSVQVAWQNALAERNDLARKLEALKTVLFPAVRLEGT